ncbi:MAG: acyl-CoA thioesterase [Promethearchaeota archaeon]
MEERILNKILNAKDSFEIKVRFNDTDHGDVHFKNYLDYFNDGFISFMKDIENPVQTAGLSGIIFPVKNLIIKYENPATFGDHVIVETKIKEIDENSITFLHKIYRESDKGILANVECVRSVMELESKKLLNVKKFFIDFV